MSPLRRVHQPVSSLPGQDDSSLSSEEEAEMSEPTWLTADLGAASDLSPPSRRERMRHSPQNAHGKEDDGKDPLLILSLVLQGPERTTWRSEDRQNLYIDGFNL